MMIRLTVSIALLIAVVNGQDYCNICGQGNSIQYPTGSVEFDYDGGRVKNNCETLQKIVMNKNAISDAFCRNELLEYTKTICSCTTPDGTLVDTLYESPTTSPAPAGPLVQNAATDTTSMSPITNPLLSSWNVAVSTIVVLLLIQCF